MRFDIATTASVLLAATSLLQPTYAAAIDGHCTSIIKVNKNVRRAGATHTYQFEVPGFKGETDNCILTNGDNGKAVETLQTNLNQCYAAERSQRIEVDGKFGSKTAALLKRAQSASGAKADGKYGPETRNKMSFWGVVTANGQVLFTCADIF